MFNFSLESILLPHFAKINSRTKRILDIGTNNGIIPLILSKKTQHHIDGVEIQTEACQIARKNMVLNHCEEQIAIVENDIKKYSQTGKKYDLIICNPPFFPLSKEFPLTKKAPKAANARHETLLTLDELLLSAKKLLDNKGYFVFCHRIDRLSEVLAKCEALRLVPKRLQFIHPYINRPAISFMLETRFQSTKGLIVEQPIIVHNTDGSFKPEIKTLYDGK